MTVWVVGRGKGGSNRPDGGRSYHTDPKCPALARATRSVFPVEEPPEHWNECSQCDGQEAWNDGVSVDCGETRRMLLNADPDGGRA